MNAIAKLIFDAFMFLLSAGLPGMVVVLGVLFIFGLLGLYAGRAKPQP